MRPSAETASAAFAAAVAAVVVAAAVVALAAGAWAAAALPPLAAGPLPGCSVRWGNHIAMAVRYKACSGDFSTILVAMCFPACKVGHYSRTSG